MFTAPNLSEELARSAAVTSEPSAGSEVLMADV